MVHSSTSGSENIHYHEVLRRVLLNAEYLSLSDMESKIQAYTGFHTEIVPWRGKCRCVKLAHACISAPAGVL